MIDVENAPGSPAAVANEPAAPPTTTQTETSKPHRQRKARPKPPSAAPPDDGLDELPFLREPPREERALYVVRRALNRAQVRALMLEHAARVIAIDFGGTECTQPKLLLRVPGGGSFPAEPNDVHELEVELLGLAATERTKMTRILEAGVLVAPEDVDIDRDLGGPLPRPPADEVLICNPAFKKDAGSSEAGAAVATAAWQAGKSR